MDNFVSKIPNTQPDTIIELEVVVLAANDFRTPQYSPITCMYGFIFDSLVVLNTPSEFRETSQKALDSLLISFLIDEIILIESPSHIALACLLESNNIAWEQYMILEVDILTFYLDIWIIA